MRSEDRIATCKGMMKRIVHQPEGVTGGQLINAAIADQYGGNVKFRFSSNHTLGLNVSNRQLNVLREDIITTEPENTLLGRIDHNLPLCWSTGGLRRRRRFVLDRVNP